MSAKQNRDQFFEERAEGWDDRHYNPEKRARLREMLAELELPKGGTVLDVGCGEGVLIPYFREIMGEEVLIIALDPSEAMLKGAALKGGGARLIRARAEKIPLDDEEAEAVVCFAAFPHVEDKAAAASEFYRLLKPGGRAYVLHLGSREEIARHHAGHEAVRGDHLPGPEGMKKIFSQAGFTGLSLEEGPGRYFFSALKEKI